MRRAAVPSSDERVSSEWPARYSGLRAMLHAEGALTNALMTIPDPAVATILGESGVDYVVIDTEHAWFPGDRLRECIAALESTPAYAVVRVASNDATLVKQILDLGADGVQIPDVRSAAEARRAVESARYAPEGHRGIGFGRASNHGIELSSYVAEANRSIAVLLMIESAAGLTAAEEIARQPGVDALVVGPVDLASDLGEGLDTAAEAVTDGFRVVIGAGLRHGVKVSVGGPIADATRWREAGAEIFMYFIDALGLDAAARSSSAQLRALIATEVR